MAFVRYKTVKGNKYYQYVRNYREGGRHKQEVLCHLGPHDSLDGAIDYESQMMSLSLSEASMWEEEANSTKAYLLETYSDVLGDEVPTMQEAYSRWEAFLEEHEESLYERRSGYLFQRCDLADEEWEKEWKRWRERERVEEDLVDSIIDYHTAQWRAALCRGTATEHRERRDKFVEVRRKYP